MFEGPEGDRLSIRELIDSYSDAVMRGDADAWGATWAEDGIWQFRSGTISGRAAIVETWTKAMTGFRSVVFMAFPGSIALAGDTATIVTHTFEHLDPVEGAPRFQAGIYQDVARRTADGWRFARRTFTSREIHL
ncbi:nuclear transport factor 2 family protein [Sphingomonas profundi]|uniref:nuclear transport factor 2 family protein n=1 Tax=Alterirhizorhabdus profundi TaxID=2681549 RepID=UPI0012E7DA6F|nr:nuclear transport factor 2 family protein [Sphingomonas profundi]